MGEKVKIYGVSTRKLALTTNKTEELGILGLCLQSLMAGAMQKPSFAPVVLAPCVKSETVVLCVQGVYKGVEEGAIRDCQHDHCIIRVRFVVVLF